MIGHSKVMVVAAALVLASCGGSDVDWRQAGRDDAQVAFEAMPPELQRFSGRRCSLMMEITTKSAFEKVLTRNFDMAALDAWSGSDDGDPNQLADAYPVFDDVPNRAFEDYMGAYANQTCAFVPNDE